MLMDAYRIPFEIDIEGLKDDLSFLEGHVWTQILADIYNHQWKGIALRSFDGRNETLSVNVDSYYYADTPLLGEMKNFDQLLKKFNCQLLRVRILALYPDEKIGEHRDLPLKADEPAQARLHIPIITNKKVEFHVNGVRYEMKAGELWFFDASVPHSVSNKGDTVRLHLVIDCLLSDWLNDLMQAGKSQAVNNYERNV